MMDLPGLDRLVALHGNATKTHEEGTHRTVCPAQTLDRVRPLLPGMGVTRLGDVTGLDTIGIPVAQAIRPNARSLSVSQGKGTTVAAAYASAAMEAAELWHAEHHRLAQYRWAPADPPEGVRLVALDRLPRRRGAFDPHRPVLWVEAIDLVSGEAVWVPEVAVGMDRTPPVDPLLLNLHVTSNGLASGNHLLEAIAHGLFEVIERDATALAAHRAARGETRRRLDLGSVTSSIPRTLIERCRTAGVHVAAWDVTSDIGLAAFDCTVLDEREDRFRPMPAASGHGCHVDPDVALCRAVTETAQSRLTAIAGSRDDIDGATYREHRASREHVARRRALLAEPTTATHGDLPDLASRTVADDLRTTLTRMIGVGLDQVLVVDLTDPTWGLPVVRVIVPGLEADSGHTVAVAPGHRARTPA